MRVVNDTLFANGVTSADLSVPWVGPAIGLRDIGMYSIQMVFTGIGEGTWGLQVSNDPQNQGDDVVYWDDKIVNWTSIAESQQLVDEAGNHTWNAREPGYLWVRPVFTPTSGSLTLTSARFMAKGV